LESIGNHRKPSISLAIIPVGVFVFVWFMTTSLATFSDAIVALSPVSSEDRSAFAWTSISTLPSSRFLLIVGQPWFLDRESEWFPVLARRESVATPQGYEWLPGGEFARRRESHDLAQAC